MDKQRDDGSVTTYEILQPDGSLDQDQLRVNPEHDRTVEMVRETYRTMQFCRSLNERAIALQRQGRIGTYPSIEGQEAAQVASVQALNETDWLIPSYRELGSLITRGVPAYRLLQFWSGDERGHRGFREQHAFPYSVPVGSQAIHAVGAIVGRHYQGHEDEIAVAYFGDGATSEGDLLEAMNMAGVQEAPVVFFCQNNQYAISVPADKQTASETFAQKGQAFGLRCIRVDGNDVFAVFQAVQEAREHALQGQPTLIEAVTYRLGDHTTSDDAGRYRPENESEQWRRKDPIKRTRHFLKNLGAWSDSDEQAMQDEHDTRIDKAVERFEDQPDPDPDEMIRYLYTDRPDQLKHGDDHG